MAENDKASLAELGDLHGQLAKELAKQIREGSTVVVRGADGIETVQISPGAAVLNVARSFLRDNAIASDPKTNTDLRNLALVMPDDDEIERRMREEFN